MTSLLCLASVENRKEASKSRKEAPLLNAQIVHVCQKSNNVHPQFTTRPCKKFCISQLLVDEVRSDITVVCSSYSSDGLSVLYYYVHITLVFACNIFTSDLSLYVYNRIYIYIHTFISYV
jgi:hypothetical protein